MFDTKVVEYPSILENINPSMPNSLPEPQGLAHGMALVHRVPPPKTPSNLTSMAKLHTTFALGNPSLSMGRRQSDVPDLLEYSMSRGRIHLTPRGNCQVAEVWKYKERTAPDQLFPVYMYISNVRVRRVKKTYP